MVRGIADPELLREELELKAACDKDALKVWAKRIAEPAEYGPPAPLPEPTPAVLTNAETCVG